jgi:hypothetical protein
LRDVRQTFSGLLLSRQSNGLQRFHAEDNALRRETRGGGEGSIAIEEFEERMENIDEERVSNGN